MNLIDHIETRVYDELYKIGASEKRIFDENSGHEKESFYQQCDIEFQLQQYDFESVQQLANTINEKSDFITEEVAMKLSIDAWKKQRDFESRDEKNEMKIPDYVYTF